ncbi:MAG: aminodeoxychorismate/anthranilate synthase component II [Methanosarcinaceae archaeon]|nr:aminodeoxychorismate/anthranilate synthase component II [Methanosarcinaceae archaeon]
MKILFINNKDSFVWNLVDYISRFEKETLVLPNSITPEKVRKIAPDVLIISPGPGHPEKPGDIGSCIALIREFGPKIPLLGVCLGHQAINVAFGGTVERGLNGPVHGKSSEIHYIYPSLFEGLKNPFQGGRYHSLEIRKLAPNLRVTARAEDGSLMAVEHKMYPIYGLQFHPESVLTPEGLKILANFLKAARTFLNSKAGS